MKSISEMDDRELNAMTQTLARHIRVILPPGSGFCLLFFEANVPNPTARYASDCDREGAIKLLRATVDRLEDQK